MKKPIPPYFEYAPFDRKSEDKQIRAFRDEHDKDDPQLTAWTVTTLILTIVMAIVGMTAVLYLICQIKAVSDFLRDLDGLTGLSTIFILACIAGILIVRSARKQFRNDNDKP